MSYTLRLFKGAKKICDIFASNFESAQSACCFYQALGFKVVWA
jgi:hypothetical protein